MVTSVVQHASGSDVWSWIIMLVVAAAAAFVAAFIFMYRARVMEDTPTSKIRSAAQGYTELEGVTEAMDGANVCGPLTATSCVWYEYKIEKYVGGRNNRWRTVEKGLCDELFWLVDDTGRCAIDPESASITPSVKQVWLGNTRYPAFGPRAMPLWLSFLSSGRYRYTEQRIHAGDSLYAIGLFNTVGGVADPGTRSAEISALLRDWKKDQKTLRERFDVNHDNEIDAREWEAARRAAAWEVDAARERMLEQEAVHTLGATGDKRHPFLLSAVLQDRLIARYRWFARGSFAAFIASGCAAVWMIGMRL